MSIKVYKDLAANSIFIEDANGAQFINSLQASVPVDKVNISDLARQIDIVSNVDHTDFIDENDNPYTGTAEDVCNQLNAIFQSSGTPSGDSPTITSPLAINSVEGSIINYELTANFGVGYEWDLSNVAGITTVEGNVRKLVGGSGLAAGTYNIPVKAINYNGEDSQTVVLTVSNPPFANTKSVEFQQNDWLGANAGILQNVLGRSGNGSGSSDAWTISFYFKAGGSSNQEQTIFYYGSNDVANGNHIRIKWNGANNAREQLIFRYGTNNNNLEFKTPVGSVIGGGGWHHYMITYDGGTTGSSSGSINDYYSRFKIFIDGVQQTTINSNSNYGITTALNGVNLRVGRYNSSGYLRDCKVDELAVWGSDESANVASIYNGGVPLDLSGLASSPVHWWRMGDGDTYPYLFDTGSAANCIYIMYSMTSSSIVNDVP
jgi:hypothetical protein